MTAIRVRPMDVPNCETVLNTAPARACVRCGNTSDTTSKPTVNKMSALMGERACAKNASYQYGQRTSMTAIRRGAAPLRRSEPTTRWNADTRWISSPVLNWQIAPMTVLGRMRRDASRALRLWTCWKLGPS